MPDLASLYRAAVGPLVRRLAAVCNTILDAWNEPSVDIAELVNAASDALAAYRNIFGRDCWNDEDRRAFEHLDLILSRHRARDGNSNSKPHPGA